MKKLFFILFSFLIISYAESESLSDRFQSAVRFYEQRDYKEAENLFLQLLREEPQSPSILQNLALIYYSQEENGRALAYLRTLTNIEPRNIENYKTIDFIESKLTNRDFENDRSFLEDINLMLLRWIRLPELLIFHFLTFAIFGFAFAQRIAQKRKLSYQDEKIVVFTPKIYAGLVSLIVLTGLSLLKINFDYTERATIITKNKLPIKSGPSENAADLYELFEGFEVTIDSTFKDWTQITYQDQYTGWVKNNNIWKHTR
jgi:tetratricopeptide (TPR) repeat protein